MWVCLTQHSALVVLSIALVPRRQEATPASASCALAPHPHGASVVTSCWPPRQLLLLRLRYGATSMARWHDAALQLGDAVAPECAPGRRTEVGYAELQAHGLRAPTLADNPPPPPPPPPPPDPECREPPEPLLVKNEAGRWEMQRAPDAEPPAQALKRPGAEQALDARKRRVRLLARSAHACHRSSLLVSCVTRASPSAASAGGRGRSSAPQRIRHAAPRRLCGDGARRGGCGARAHQGASAGGAGQSARRKNAALNTTETVLWLCDARAGCARICAAAAARLGLQLHIREARVLGDSLHHVVHGQARHRRGCGGGASAAGCARCCALTHL